MVSRGAVGTSGKVIGRWRSPAQHALNPPPPPHRAALAVRSAGGPYGPAGARLEAAGSGLVGQGCLQGKRRATWLMRALRVFIKGPTVCQCLPRAWTSMPSSAPDQHSVQPRDGVSWPPGGALTWIPGGFGEGRGGGGGGEGREGEARLLGTRVDQGLLFSMGTPEVDASRLETRGRGWISWSRL